MKRNKVKSFIPKNHSKFYKLMNRFVNNFIIPLLVVLIMVAIALAGLGNWLLGCDR